MIAALFVVGLVGWICALANRQDARVWEARAKHAGWNGRALTRAEHRLALLDGDDQ